MVERELHAIEDGSGVRPDGSAFDLAERRQ